MSPRATGHRHQLHPPRARPDKKPLVVADVFGKIDEMVSGVNQFLGAVYHGSNANLKKKPTMAVCGFFQGRVYSSGI